MLLSSLEGDKIPYIWGEVVLGATFVAARWHIHCSEKTQNVPQICRFVRA